MKRYRKFAQKRKFSLRPLYHEAMWELLTQKASIDELREVASQICRDYLTGRWRSVNADQLTIRRISGGLSNFLYYISLPEVENTTDAPTAGASAEVENNVNNNANVGVSDGAVTAANRTATNVTTSETDKNRNAFENNHDMAVDNVNKANKRARTESDETANEKRSLLPGSTQGTEPQEVLIRIYGQAHGADALEAMITETVVFTLLSERNFGPKLHGIFPGGRIEQFIPARALLTKELSIPSISMKIAEKMGEIHGLDIPLSKEPDFCMNCLKRWSRKISDILYQDDWGEMTEYVNLVRQFDFQGEISWLKQEIARGNYKVVFCHNDMQEGNILLCEQRDSVDNSNLEDSAIDNCNCKDDCAATARKESNKKIESVTSRESVNLIPITPDSELIIIDFEYCAYNYRGFDLANHFVEWTMDYTNPQAPFYHYDKTKYPTKQQRVDFITTYLGKLNENVEGYIVTAEEIEDIEKEVRLFSLFSHFFWMTWSVVNVTSAIEFGYWEYAVTRMREYIAIKEEILKTHTSVQAML